MIYAMKNNASNLIAIVLLMIGGCKSATRSNQDSSEKKVIGADQRVSILSEKYPWSAIGYFSFFKAIPKDKNGKEVKHEAYTPFSHCTAFLVWRNLALTNAHCVNDVNTGLRSTDMEIAFNRQGVKTIGRVPITVVAKGAVRLPSNDWAIVKTTGFPGDEFGWFNVASNPQFEAWIRDQSTQYPDTNLKKFVLANVILAGYSRDIKGGNTAGVNLGCKFIGISKTFNTPMHNCDSEPGASGSPIFVWNATLSSVGAQLIALHRGSIELDKANLGVKPTMFQKDLDQAIADERAINGDAARSLADIIKARGFSFKPDQAN